MMNRRKKYPDSDVELKPIKEETSSSIESKPCSITEETSLLDERTKAISATEKYGMHLCPDNDLWSALLEGKGNYCNIY
ncbi:MAG: hypothetical protein ABI370_06615 [Gammaproteobacteria bacterium]